MRLTGPPAFVAACHCTACQQRTGSAFGVGAYYAHEQAAVDGASTVYVRIGDSGSPVEFHFCPICGSTVFWLPTFRPNLFAVALGCMDGEKPAPGKQAYCGQRLDWVTLDVGDER